MIGEIGEKVQDDGPSGKLNSPVSIVSCGNAICIAEYPTDIKEFTPDRYKRIYQLRGFNPSGTKGFGTHTKHRGGGGGRRSKWTHSVS